MKEDKRQKYDPLHITATPKDKIRVTAPGHLPEGYTFEAHYTLPDGEEIAFEATVVSSIRSKRKQSFSLKTS